MIYRQFVTRKNNTYRRGSCWGLYT